VTAASEAGTEAGRHEALERQQGILFS